MTLFYWSHATCRQPFETGVERVVRRLAQALTRSGIDVVPIGYDDQRRCFEIIGKGAAAFEARLAAAGESPLLFVPELTAARIFGPGEDLMRLARGYGMRVQTRAHDTLPLKLRTSHYSDVVVADFEAYFRRFADVDRVVATTEMTAREIRAFLASEDLHVPPIDVVHLPAQFATLPRVVARSRIRCVGEPLKLVTVGSFEPRKNLPRMLRALVRAQRALRIRIELTVVGLRGRYPAYDADVDSILAEAVHVTLAGSVPDPAIAALIADCDATIFPSLDEGFGLPIGESLWLGRPCICHDGSAMAEIAPGGGTLMIDMADEGLIVDTFLSLATTPALLERLSAEAVGRTLTSWEDFAGRIAAVLGLAG